ncbi:MAG: chromosomal replication initiator protein DnaA [Planctomycetales bacterium]|nr:chromosomal replication initiator protein DnaA [Planctomycetales bacterium]
MERLWPPVLSEIERQLDGDRFRVLFQGTELVAYDGQTAEVAVPDRVQGDAISRGYLGTIRDAFVRVAGLAPEVRITIREKTEAIPPLVLNPSYTFENFVVGSSNRLAHAAAIAVADSPGLAYNPLFLHGSVGLGKTHLLQAICHAVIRRPRQLQILYLSCESFTNDFVSALERGQVENFRYKYRHVDVLLIDDIQFLAKTEKTQEEFFHTFNTLYNAQKQIILSSDSAPKDIPTLEERLVSRFKWGLVSSIDPPSLEMRVAILRNKARIRGLEFPPDVVQFIAETVTSNIRELEGAVLKLLAYAKLTERPVDLALAREVLQDYLRAPLRRVTIDGIVQRVTQAFGVKLADIQGKRRTKSVSLPRQVCMYLARSLTDHSLEEIGGYFGGRDHTTVIAALDRVKLLRERDPAFSGLVDKLTKELFA